MTDKAWSVLIPVKVLAEAKSRLASLAGPAPQAITIPRQAGPPEEPVSQAAPRTTGSRNAT